MLSRKARTSRSSSRTFKGPVCDTKPNRSCPGPDRKSNVDVSPTLFVKSVVIDDAGRDVNEARGDVSKIDSSSSINWKTVANSEQR